MTLTGTVTQRFMLSLFPVESQGEFNGNWYFDDLYNQPSSFAAIAGSYYGGTNSSLIIDSSGDITSADGCIVGQVSLIDTAYNAYDFNLTYTEATDCDVNLATATGKGIGSLDTNMTPAVLEIMVLWINPVYGITGNTLFMEVRQ